MSRQFSGPALAAHREARGWTVGDAARRLRTPAATLRRWEAGEAQPSAESVDKIAHYFGVSPTALMSSVSTTPMTHYELSPDGLSLTRVTYGVKP